MVKQHRRLIERVGLALSSASILTAGDSQLCSAVIETLIGPIAVHLSGFYLRIKAVLKHIAVTSSGPEVRSSGKMQSHIV